MGLAVEIMIEEKLEDCPSVQVLVSSSSINTILSPGVITLELVVPTK